MRPVCKARNAPNAPLGNIISQPIKGASNSLSDKLGTEGNSTEGVCYQIMQCNTKISKYKDQFRTLPRRKAKDQNRNFTMKGQFVLGSMDVKALYPSIQWGSGAVEVGKGINESKTSFENVNFRELCQYLAVTYSRDELVKAELDNYIPTKKSGTLLKLAAREGDQESLFNWADVKEPDEKIKQALLGLAVRKGVHTCMSNHYYTFNGQLRRQAKGGSIGSELTGEVARLYMLRWDDKFLSKLKKLRLSPQLYIRYVDDTLVVTETIKPGVRFSRKKGVLTFNQNLVEEDMLMPDDARTFSVLRDIADSIDKDIQWEEDVPSGHANNKLPCLDMELWLEKDKVLFQFYSKPMASKQLINARSALSSQSKRSSIFQEAMRRLLNCNPDCHGIPKLTFYQSLVTACVSVNME